MLVLTRKVGEKIVVGDDVVVEILEVQGNRIRIGVKAPRGICIMRQELLLELSDALPMIEQPASQFTGIS